MLDPLRQDLRFAARSLLRGRGATVVALLSYGIGLAANVTVFSLVQAVEFPQTIYPDAARIVILESNNHTRALVGMPVSAPDALDIGAAARTLERAALAAEQSSVLREGSPPARIAGRRVMPAFFDVLAVSASLGRVLREGDPAGTMVLGHGLWREAFGADPAVVGRSIRLDGGSVTVVGVMPAGFDRDADFWVPLDSRREFARDDRQFTLVARLAASASWADATAEIEQISRRLEDAYPSTNQNWTTIAIPFTRLHGRDSRGTFFLLQAAVLFVLLIACANIANIRLARGIRRQHEMAVRVSLGASRARILRWLLTESVLLALIGGAFGVLLSIWGIPFMRVVGGFPDVLEPTLNRFVLGFAAALAIGSGVLSGMVPALRSSGAEPSIALRHEDPRSGNRSTGWLQWGLVVAQIACAVVLATGAALMVRTLINRQQLDLGFDPRGAIRADLMLSGPRYNDGTAIRSTTDALLERLNAAPDIHAAGALTWALPTGAGAQRHLTLPAERDRALPGTVRRGIEAVTPAYFRALGVPIRTGRAFTPADREGSPAVAIVNEELARHLWPGRSPIGELLRLGSPADGAPLVTVVGVAGTIRRSAMHDIPVARVYVPFAQHPNMSISLVVRARANVRAAERELHAAIEAADPALFAEGLRTVEADLAQFVAPIRMIGGLLAGFGLAGLLLAALGVFGTMSYMVSQRERELAVRAALGAGRADIFRLVFGSALRMTLAGIAVGIVLAVAATRALESLLFAVSPTDPLTLTAVVAVLGGAALAACYRPARIAAAADPMTLLRRE